MDDRAVAFFLNMGADDNLLSVIFLTLLGILETANGEVTVRLTVGP